LFGFLGSGVLDRKTRDPLAAGAAGLFGDPPSPSAMEKVLAGQHPGPPKSKVPREPKAVAAPEAATQPTAASPAVLPDGRVVLNLATAADLDKLPGIGMKKAEAIVELRTKLGGKLTSLMQLTRVRGIKRRFIEKLKPLVVLDPPSESGGTAQRE
jgi:competence protein ComEA